MADTSSPSRDIRFGVFEVDVNACELRKKGSRVKLQRQPFILLSILLDPPGKVVKREEIRQRLWPAEVNVDFDRSLNKAMVKLREALGDSSDSPLYIETLPGIGYRFIGLLNRAPAATLPTEPGQSSVEVEKAAVPLVGNSRRRFLWIGVAATLLAGWPLSKIELPRFARGNAPLAPIHSLAVLPLANLSGDPGQDFFAEGMTEELTTDLGKVSALRVISRTSTMQYKGTRKSLSEIAHELNVDAVVEGTVARSGNHVRITANLIQASPEKHLWAESYESEVGDAFTMQGQIAQALTREIQVKLTQQEQSLLAAPRPVNPEAQDLYLRGLYIARGSERAESSDKAIKYFQQAIEKDPNYAAAYAALAHTYSVWLPGMTHTPRELMPKAKEFALKALSLDNTLSQAHCVLGMIALLYDWDWAAAEEQYKQTVALNPNYFGVYGWHSRGLIARGSTEEGIAEAKRTLALSPSPLSWDYPIWVFVLARRHDLATDRAKALIEVAPDWVWSHFAMAMVYEGQGRLEEAAKEYLKCDELFGTDSRKIAQLRRAMAKSGAQGYWRQTVENYKESAKSGYVPPVLVAEACVRVGDKNCAFAWLEKGFQERDDLMINLEVEPVFDPLRSDPRFLDLIHRVGIPQ
jgi:TolB-like protein/DNA-binding winged helix-turn-helix (wHTH) protein